MIPHINYLHTQVRLPRHLEQLPINVENPQKIQNAPQTVTERRASTRSGNVIQVNTPGLKMTLTLPTIAVDIQESFTAETTLLWPHLV